MRGADKFTASSRADFDYSGMKSRFEVQYKNQATKLQNSLKLTHRLAGDEP